MITSRERLRGSDTTRVEYRWRVNTRGKASVIGPLLNIKKRHSEVMQSGFRKLNEWVTSGQEPPTTA